MSRHLISYGSHGKRKGYSEIPVFALTPYEQGNPRNTIGSSGILVKLLTLIVCLRFSRKAERL